MSRKQHNKVKFMAQFFLDFFFFIHYMDAS